jgi:hypothetical protein
MIGQVQSLDRRLMPTLMAWISVAVVSPAACAFEAPSGGTVNYCTPGEVSMGCICNNYQDPQVCGDDRTFNTCADACSGKPCCDPGFAPTPVTFGPATYDGCRPGPSQLWNTLCCPQADAANCPASCGATSSCSVGLTCCTSDTPAGAECLEQCDDYSMVCTTSSDCATGQICSPYLNTHVKTCQSKAPCLHSEDCGSGQSCCVPYVDALLTLQTCIAGLSCPNGQLQLCQASSECPGGETCQPMFGAVQACTSIDGGADDGAPSGADL